jgi:hypothetical protein
VLVVALLYGSGVMYTDCELCGNPLSSDNQLRTGTGFLKKVADMWRLRECGFLTCKLRVLARYSEADSVRHSHRHYADMPPSVLLVSVRC